MLSKRQYSFYFFAIRLVCVTLVLVVPCC